MAPGMIHHPQHRSSNQLLLSQQQQQQQQHTKQGAMYASSSRLSAATRRAQKSGSWNTAPIRAPASHARSALWPVHTGALATAHTTTIAWQASKGKRATSAAAVRKTPSFFEFSLCLSRACLGKMIVFIYKWLKKVVFRRAYHHPAPRTQPGWCRGQGVQRALQW